MLLTAREKRARADAVVKRGSPEWPVVPPNASLLAAPRASARRIRRYVEYVAHRTAASWPAAAVDELMTSYAAACEMAGLDLLLVICELLVETDELKSASTRLRVDPTALAFAVPACEQDWPRSWKDCARFHVGVLLAYALPDGAENAGQRLLLNVPRVREIVSPEKRGSAPTLDLLLRDWGGGGEPYLAKLLDHTDSILMPQY